MVSKILAVATALAFAAQGVVGCTRTYTVKEGDFCDQISRDNKLSTYQLFANNVGKFNKFCTDLKPEDVLCLGSTVAEDCQDIYAVQPGDICDTVSSTHGVSLEILYQNNPQINAECSNIYIGEVLCVAKEKKSPPKPDGLEIAPLYLPTNPAPASAPAPVVAPAPVAAAAPSPNPAPAVDDDDDYCEY